MQNRLYHKRETGERRIVRLDDTTFRVWFQFRQSADDYGVMRRSALPIMTNDPNLGARPTTEIEAALERLIDGGILIPFTDDGSPWVCQPDWQDIQKVRHPSQTVNPCPPGEVLEQCSEATVELFRIHPRTNAESFRKRSKAKKRDHDKQPMANGLLAYGLDKERGEESDGTAAVDDLIAQRAWFEEVFWPAYPNKRAKDAARKAVLKLSPEGALRATILVALETQKAAEPWRGYIARGGDELRFIPHAATWINGRRWTDVVQGSRSRRARDLETVGNLAIDIE